MKPALVWRSMFAIRRSTLVVVAVTAAAVVLSGNSSAKTKDKSAHHQQAKATSPKARLLPGLGPVHHPVSSKSLEAQKFFDQGLAFVYGFDHEAAQKSFEQAAQLDPKLAMAWWGVAYALGPNINIPVDPAREKAAYDAIQRALALQDNASQPERGYINALAYRYSNDPKADLHQLDGAYRDAMARLVKSYPDDVDAATLYAESLMDLHPWHLWFHDGRPNEGTEEIVAVLESVLKRDPNHLGANHYYIHAVEGSPHPERGLPSAIRLETLAPAAGHLTHMPSHIHARVGSHSAAVKSNESAIVADKKFFTNWGKGMVAVMYHAHNVHFLAYSACMADNFNKAKEAADTVAEIAAPHISQMPEMEGFLSNFMCASVYVRVAFERWDDILKLPKPANSIPLAVWHFSRALAFAGKGDSDAAQKERDAWQQITSKIDPQQMLNETNSASSVFKIHGNMIAAALARTQHDDTQAIHFLTEAVAAEDALDYNEPPGFFPPVRPVLGRLLMDTKQFAEAEKVYRAALEKSPRLPRALSGLRDSLKAQNRVYEAQQIEQQMNNLAAGGAVTSDRAVLKSSGRLAD